MSGPAGTEFASLLKARLTRPAQPLDAIADPATDPLGDIGGTHSPAPNYFPHISDALDYIEQHCGNRFAREDPAALEQARALGIEQQFVAIRDLSRGMDETVSASVVRAERRTLKIVTPILAPARVPPTGVPALASWPAPLDLEKLAEREPEKPRFIVPDWGPTGYAWMISGHGGAGKSLLALTLAVCIASGRDFFGLPVERSRVMLLSCEDRENVIHWRLARVCAAMGVDLASLRGWLEVVDLVGHDSILWAPDPRTGNTLTAAYGALAHLVEQQETQVLVVDGISDTFGGNENSRSEVKRYVNALLALIPPDSGALLLVGHVNKTTAGGAGLSEGYSGSTAWHNAVRARWYLHPESKGDDGDVGDRSGGLVLDLQKSNLGRADQSLHLAWDDAASVFAGRAAGTGYALLDRATQEREEVDGILKALRECHARGYVPAATSGRRTAYNVLSASKEFPSTLRQGKVGAKRFWKHLESLRLRGDVVDGAHKGPDRHSVRTIEPAGNAG